MERDGDGGMGGWDRRSGSKFNEPLCLAALARTSDIVMFDLYE